MREARGDCGLKGAAQDLCSRPQLRGGSRRCGEPCAGGGAQGGACTWGGGCCEVQALEPSWRPSPSDRPLVDVFTFVPAIPFPGLCPRNVSLNSDRAHRADGDTSETRWGGYVMACFLPGILRGLREHSSKDVDMWDMLGPHGRREQNSELQLSPTATLINEEAQTQEWSPWCGGERGQGWDYYRSIFTSVNFPRCLQSAAEAHDFKETKYGGGGGEALSQKASLKHGFGGELGGGLLMQVHPHPQALSIGVCVAKAQQVPLIILGDCGQSSPFRAGVSWSPSWTPKQP